jgi:hypothetical protein
MVSDIAVSPATMKGPLGGEVCPRGWDHLVASDGTTCVVAGRLTACVRTRRDYGGRVSYREVTVIEIKDHAAFRIMRRGIPRGVWSQAGGALG